MANHDTLTEREGEMVNRNKRNASLKGARKIEHFSNNKNKDEAVRFA